MEEENRKNGRERKICLIMGILGIVFCWLVFGIIFSIIGIVFAIKSIKGGFKKPVVGLALSVISLIIGILMLILFVSFGGSVSTLEEQEGIVSMQEEQQETFDAESEDEEEQETETKVQEESVKTTDESQFQSAVEAIGMDYANVKNVQNLDDWASGKRYSFVYDGFGYIVYELDNGEIESINTEFGRDKIYERGYEPLNYKDFEPDTNTLETLQADALKQISEYITNETSIDTKMGSMMYERAYDFYRISGEIKAKNAVSKKDFTFTVDYIIGNNSYECTYIAIDGAIVYGSDQKPEIQKEELVQDEKSENGETIVLSYEKEGEYGQYDLFDGEPYLRYYVPIGNYKVKCNIRGGFYIETIELHKEDGWDTPTTIEQIMMEAGEEKEISIEEGQCISLIINTEIELTPIAQTVQDTGDSGSEGDKSPYEKGQELGQELTDKLDDIDWEDNYDKAEETGKEAAEWLNGLFE